MAIMGGYLLGEDTLRPDTVVAQLRDEFRTGIELLFFADLLDKFNNDLFIVQTAVEIEYVRFQVDRIVFLERRASADVGHAAEDLFTDADLDRVHAQRRNYAISDKDVGRRESDLFPPAVAVHDLSHHGNRAA